MCPYCTTNICWNMLRKVFYTSRFRFECIYHMLPHVKDKCPYVRLCLGRFMKRRLCISLSRLEMPQIIKIEINLNQSVLRKNIRLCLSEGFCPPSPHRYIFFTVYQFFTELCVWQLTPKISVNLWKYSVIHRLEPRQTLRTLI